MPIFIAVHKIIRYSLAVIIRSSECDYTNFLNWFHMNENAAFLGCSFCRPPIWTLGAIVKLRKVTVRVYKLGSRWMDFREVLYRELLLKTIEKIKFG